MTPHDRQPPAARLTDGPRFHWFGYYDKLQFDAADRRVLAMETSFEHRPPTPDDEIAVGVIDLGDANRWTPLGTSRTWCWQQGCMAQWRPGSDDEVIWNDREGDRLVSRVTNVATGERRVVAAPVYTIAPDGRTAVAPDFRRIDDTRPGYGYATPGGDPFRDELAPSDSGVFRVDLETGASELILSLADIAAFRALDYAPGSKHWVNHLLFCPDGSRFIFLHRWKVFDENWTNRGPHNTRMLTAAADGSDLRVLEDSGLVSHFIWRDPQTLLAFARHGDDGRLGFFLYEDRDGGDVKRFAPGQIDNDSHVSFLPDGEWVVGDHYPNERGERALFLYHAPSDRKVPLGEFQAFPETYAGDWRCDLHPRVSRDGRKIAIDSVHEGLGRQVYLVDVGPIVEK